MLPLGPDARKQIDTRSTRRLGAQCGLSSVPAKCTGENTKASLLVVGTRISALAVGAFITDRSRSHAQECNSEERHATRPRYAVTSQCVWMHAKDGFLHARKKERSSNGCTKEQQRAFCIGTKVSFVANELASFRPTTHTCELKLDQHETDPQASMDVIDDAHMKTRHRKKSR
jgi:hypothetical protein